jgi:hypothetical protein
MAKQHWQWSFNGHLALSTGCIGMDIGIVIGFDGGVKESMVAHH